MNTPPLLVLAALLFWGWQTGHLWLGLLAGLALELSRVIKTRWSLNQADFNRLWNICTVLFIGVGTFLLVNEGTVSLDDFFAHAGRRPEAMRQAGQSALTWFQWFPMIFLPFLLAQVFNDPPRVGLATFSWWLRKQEARTPNSTLPRDTVDVSFPYVALCLLAASARTERAVVFYYGFTLVVAWALLALRPRRLSLVPWCALFLAVAVAGYGAHTGLFRLQKRLEEMNMTWFAKFSGLGFNDREARTRIGSIGHLKNSDRIVLRLRTEGDAPPELLRETSFNAYRLDSRGTSLWTVTNRSFTSVPSESDPSAWMILPRKPTRFTLSIAGYFRGGQGLLPLPTGAAGVAGLWAGDVQTNYWGGAKMIAGPGLAIYEARHDRGVTFDSAWSEEDLRTFEELEPALAQVARELRLRREMPPQEALRTVARFFTSQFQYARYLTAASAATTNETALARFLLRTKSGHCEYFATATTLLLRHAGVPTRYAVGYSVQEGKGSKYVVRDRHAHAWTLAWNGTNWIDFDTTPSSWDAAESAHTSWLQPVKDFLSDLWFEFSKIRWGKTEWRKWLMLAPVPLLIVVLVRFAFGKQWKQRRAQRQEKRRAAQRAGADSDFYLIEKHFAARGLERAASENWSQWLRRVEESVGGGRWAVGRSPALNPQPSTPNPSLRRLLALHQRHRFDPRGLGETERGELRGEVSRWLAQG